MEQAPSNLEKRNPGNYVEICDEHKKKHKGFNEYWNISNPIFKDGPVEPTDLLPEVIVGDYINLNETDTKELLKFFKDENIKKALLEKTPTEIKVIEILKKPEGGDKLAVKINNNFTTDIFKSFFEHIGNKYSSYK